MEKKNPGLKGLNGDKAESDKVRKQRCEKNHLQIENLC